MPDDLNCQPKFTSMVHDSSYLFIKNQCAPMCPTELFE